ncbi:nuclear GTPase SLIP-GC [Leptosomus discolor]
MWGMEDKSPIISSSQHTPKLMVLRGPKVLHPQLWLHLSSTPVWIMLVLGKPHGQKGCVLSQEDLAALSFPGATIFCLAYSPVPSGGEHGTARSRVCPGWCEPLRMEGQRPGKRGGNADLPTEAGQKKKSKRDQNPEDGKEEALKDYKRVQDDLKDVLHRSAEKLSQFLSKHSLPETRQRIEHLKNRLTGLKPDILQDPIYIGLFGSTGAGKSTLLNAIIDKNFFLPVSGTKSCTSCVVQVNASPSKHYEAKIHLLTEEEWKDELKGLVALAEGDGDMDDSERQEAVLKISAIYGGKAGTKSYKELCSMNPIIPIPTSRCITFRRSNERDFAKQLRPYISTRSNDSGEHPPEAGTSVEGRNAQLWPLIRNVEVTIPRVLVVPEGVVFLDIPGTGDFNSKRDAMWKENINKCSVIWVVNAIKRIGGDKTHEVLLKEGMKAFQCGMCQDISLVVTMSDEMDVAEYCWENNIGNMNEHDAILERNETVKQEKRVTMKENLERKLPSDSYVLHKPDLVYTVSAREYWTGKVLNKEETEIPKLREYIQKFYEEHKRNRLMDHVEEALVVFSLIQSLRSSHNAQYQYVKTSHLKDLIMEKIVDLGKDIEKCFTPIDQPLTEGVADARRLHNTTIDRIVKALGLVKNFLSFDALRDDPLEQHKRQPDSLQQNVLRHDTSYPLERQPGVSGQGVASSAGLYAKRQRCSLSQAQPSAQPPTAARSLIPGSDGFIAEHGVLWSGDVPWRDHGFQGYHRTLKAVCLNKGAYPSRVFGRLDINSSLAQPIYEKIDMSFGNMFRIQMGASSTLKACLDTFKGAVQQQLQKAMTEHPAADLKDENRFLQQETDFIIRDTEKFILQKKADIYNSLTVSIQNDLLPCYEEAARQRGEQALRRMQTILSEGIRRELERGMFEKAEKIMRGHFQALKVEIIRKMEQDFSDKLTLIFCPWDQVNSELPDLQDEISSIRSIHEKLHPAWKGL